MDEMAEHTTVKQSFVRLTFLVLAVPMQSDKNIFRSGG